MTIQQREQILKILDENSVDKDELSSRMAVSLDDIQPEVTYLEENGYVEVKRHQIGTRIFEVLRITVKGIHFLERASEGIATLEEAPKANKSLTRESDGNESRKIVEETPLYLRITEEPFTAQNLKTIISALIELHTKCWLLQESRYADLTDYTQTGNPRFDEEAILLITRLTYNSPVWLTLVSTVLSAGGLAVMTKLIDIVVQVRLRYREKVVEIDNKRIEYQIEEISKVLELISKHADSETKRQAVEAFVPTLIELGKGKGLELTLLAEENNKSTTTKPVR